MRLRIRTAVCCTAIFSAVSFFTITFAETNPLSKTQVADQIRKVENGVDDFEIYLTSRGENAQIRPDRRRAAEKQSAARVQTPRRKKSQEGKNQANEKTTLRTSWTI